MHSKFQNQWLDFQTNNFSHYFSLLLVFYIWPALVFFQIIIEQCALSAHTHTKKHEHFEHIIVLSFLLCFSFVLFVFLRFVWVLFIFAFGFKKIPTMVRNLSFNKIKIKTRNNKKSYFYYYCTQLVTRDG